MRSPMVTSSIVSVIEYDVRAEAREASKTKAALDAVLVDRYKGGDSEAFVEIMLGHRERIYNLLLVRLRNRFDAEEITQDTFIRASRGLVNFRGDSSLTTWLHRIALNLARNRYWYNLRRHVYDSFSTNAAIDAENDRTFADLIASSEQSPVHALAVEEFNRLVDRCMGLLGGRQREILTMRNIRHLSYIQIADILYISVGTVKSRIARARADLRRHIGESCPELATDEEIIRLLTPDKSQQTSVLKVL